MTLTGIFQRVLLYGAVLAAAIALIGAILGGIAVGTTGVVSALIGTGMAVLFMAITAAIVLLATRLANSTKSLALFFGIVMGGWLLKFAVFLVLVFLLKDQPFVHPVVLFLSVVAGVVGSLVVDLIVVAKSRMPYASDVTLPEAPEEPS